MSKTIESYVRSSNSSNLIDDENHHSTDILAAVALSSQLGYLLFRAKYSGDGYSIKPLMLAWRTKVAVRAEKYKWIEQSNSIADISLDYWLKNICKVCHGRAAPKIENAPMLEDIVCPSCNGSGKAAIQCKPELLDKVKDCVEILNQMERESGMAAMKKLDLR